MIAFTTIKLDKQREMKFGMKAMIEYEKITGNKILEMTDEKSLENISAMLWCMLKHEDKELTLDKTLDIIDNCDAGLVYIIEKVTEMLILSTDDGSKNAPTPTVK